MLFNIFFSDLEEFLRKSNPKGVKINNSTDILVLAYADDIVILANSAADRALGLGKILRKEYAYDQLRQDQSGMFPQGRIQCRASIYLRQRKHRNH